MTQQPLDNLSETAQRVYRSLLDHPEICSPQAIANGADDFDQLSTDDVADALEELQQAGRAASDQGSWLALEGPSGDGK